MFLRDGSVLASYGAAVVVADRLIFNLLIDPTAVRSSLQLMSLPLSSIDEARTARYAEAIRAREYGMTRGEADYAAVSAEVTRALEQLATVRDAQKRVGLAEQARARLVAWSNAHYRYRADDIAELAGLFDDVIGELKVAAGGNRFSLDLVADAAPPAYEPILAPLGLRASIEMALGAVDAADLIEERYALLRNIERAITGPPELADLARATRTRLVAEARADAAYRALADEFSRRAAAARLREDQAIFARLRTELGVRDAKLGRLRPAAVRAIEAGLAAEMEAMRADRLARDHARFVRSQVLRYQRAARPAIAVLTTARATLEAIGAAQSVAFAQLETAQRRLATAAATLSAMVPPDGTASIHATFVSAVQMAVEACARRARAVVTRSVQVDREAASAATGALLLGKRAAQDLAAALMPVP